MTQILEAGAVLALATTMNVVGEGASIADDSSSQNGKKDGDSDKPLSIMVAYEVFSLWLTAGVVHQRAGLASEVLYRKMLGD